VVRVSGYRSRGLSLIPGTTRISDKYWVWNGVHSVTSTIEELLERKSSGTGLENLMAMGSHRANHATPLYPQRWALTTPTSGGRLISMVRSRTKAKELRGIYSSRSVSPLSHGQQSNFSYGVQSSI
jgi:hypothetical protein